VSVLKNLISIFTDAGDVVIDPVSGSGTTLRACAELNRNCYGFEIKKEFVKKAKEQMLSEIQCDLFSDYSYKMRYGDKQNGAKP
jgi:site-specific DNA-methyltransferase (adenine-specific)